MNLYFSEINESAFYAILRRIYGAGYTEVYFQEPTLGPKRKYYSKTNIGKNELEQYINVWKKITTIVSDIGIDIKY